MCPQPCPGPQPCPPPPPQVIASECHAAQVGEEHKLGDTMDETDQSETCGLSLSPSTTMSPLTQSDKYALAFQLVAQLTSLVDGTIFAKRVAVLRNIKEAWEKNKEVTIVTEEDKFVCGDQLNLAISDMFESVQNPQLGPDDSNVGSSTEKQATFQAVGSPAPVDVVVKQEMPQPGMPRIEQVVSYGLPALETSEDSGQASSFMDESGCSVAGSMEEECLRSRLDTERLFEELGNNRAQVKLEKLSLTGPLQLSNRDLSPRDQCGFVAGQENNSHDMRPFEDDPNQEEEDSPLGGKMIKPKRPCPYCGIFQSQLKRHIVKKHKNKVKAIQDLPKQKQKAEFRKLRLDGIYLHNKEVLQSPNNEDKLLRERKSKRPSSTVMCTNCHGFYSPRYFWSHKPQCTEESSVRPKAVPTSLLQPVPGLVRDAFEADILSGLRADDIGNICKSDAIIRTVGQRLYEKRKSKQDDLNGGQSNSVRADMRRLASLYLIFCRKNAKSGSPITETGTAADMLNRQGFEVLRDTITSYTSTTKDLTTTAKDTTTTSPDPSGLKAGLKNVLFYLLMTTAKIIRGAYLLQGKDKLAKEVEHFVQALDLNRQMIFGDATYHPQRPVDDEIMDVQ
ncbi:uncharacterized protein LOC119733401 isoform X2 [Patiria miniata]|uniref:Uncharacterized protein n=1 Tax=Patiria miniata TaxID=46514 RepID=A0A914AHP9_PATMI|nr:uncharacterized protein LOC119733401 isoform X2 [Patiria miniata]